MSKTFKKFLILTLRTEFLLGVVAFILNIFKAIILGTNLFLIIALVIALSWLNFFFSNYTEELSVFERFNDLQEGDSRQVLIKNAMTLFYDSPFWGYGVNGYEYMKETSFHDIRDSHNMLVSILATSGLLGFTSILCFFKRIIASIRTSFRNDKFATALLVYVFLISMKTGGIITYSMMWFAYALILSNSLFNRNDAKK